jgi:hypothetical protein
MTTIDQSFDNHAASIAAGLAAMNPTPRHRFPLMRVGDPDPLAATATEPRPEETDDRVWREAGLVSRYDLRLQGQADVTGLAEGLLSKKETARLLQLQAVLDRFAQEIDASGKIPMNAGKVAALAPVGEMPPEADIIAGAGGDQTRAFRRQVAKAGAVSFFEQECRPFLLDIFARVATVLETYILARRKDEEEAFDLFARTYHAEGDSAPYKPSPGLIRFMARRRALLDGEIPHVSPPSLRAVLSGILNFPADA